METSTLVTEQELKYFDSFHTSKVNPKDRKEWKALLTKSKESKIDRLRQKFNNLLDIQQKDMDNYFDIVHIGEKILAEQKESKESEQEISAIVNVAKKKLEQLISEEKSSAATGAGVVAGAGAGVAPAPASSYFFEGQQSLYCGKHALNNLLQEEKFFHDNAHVRFRPNKINLHRVCLNLKEVLRARAGVYGIIANDAIINCPDNGNYQQDVLVKALLEAEYDVIAFPFDNLTVVQVLLAKLKENGLKGFLINKGGWHWVAVAYLSDRSYMYLDSFSNRRTRTFNNEQELFEHLETQSITRVYAVAKPVIPSHGQEFSSDDYARVQK